MRALSYTLTVGNFCPWCMSTKSSRQVAQHHVHRMFVSGVCRADRSPYPHELAVQSLGCPVCDVEAADAPSLATHIRTHASPCRLLSLRDVAAGVAPPVVATAAAERIRRRIAAGAAGPQAAEGAPRGRPDRQVGRGPHDLVGRDGVALARLHIVGAQVEQTILIPRDDPLAPVMAEAGRKSHDLAPEDKSKFGPPRLEQRMALLDSVAAATSPTIQAEVLEVKRYRDRIATPPVGEAAMLVRQCWMSQTFDKKETSKMNRIAYHYDGMHTTPDGQSLPIDFAIGRIQGSVVKIGPPPPLSAERKVCESLQRLLRPSA